MAPEHRRFFALPWRQAPPIERNTPTMTACGEKRGADSPYERVSRKDNHTRGTRTPHHFLKQTTTSALHCTAEFNDIDLHTKPVGRAAYKKTGLPPFPVGPVVVTGDWYGCGDPLGAAEGVVSASHGFSTVAAYAISAVPPPTPIINVVTRAHTCSLESRVFLLLATHVAPKATTNSRQPPPRA